MLILYQAVVSLLLLISPFIIIYRILKKKEDINRFKEKFSLNTRKKIKRNLIWFHGASVGEILSVIPLVKYYENQKSIHQILITSSTLSSSKVIKKFNFKKTVHQYYPIDHFLFTNAFLKYWKPTIAIFIDSEIWPSMFRNLKNKDIPLVLINARLTKKTISNWMMFKNYAISVFKNITVAYPQNIETNFFLKKINSMRINFIGNLKYAESIDKNNDKLNKKLQTRFKNKKLWVASSTHNNEELLCTYAHIILKKKVKNLLTIIIPRHINRVSKIITEIKKLKLKVTTHSSNNEKLINEDIYIVDTFGETKKFHKVASTVFLGGSIINKGGQNPLEAARYGAKILHGPNVDNFKDVYKSLKKLKMSKKVSSPKQIASNIIFKKNENLGKKIKNIGDKILKKTIKELDILINNELKKT